MTPTDYTEPPKLESGIARAGIIGVALLSAGSNFWFWHTRGDDMSGLLTLGAHAIALGGFSLFVHHHRTAARSMAAGAALVTALAAGWCGMTMFERLNDEAQARATATAEASTAYSDASHDLIAARTRLAIVQADRGPDAETTVAARLSAWGANHAAALADAATERDRAQARLDALTPAPTIDPMSLIRGLGLQLAELIGLAVFGLGGSPRRMEAPIAPPAPVEETETVVDLEAAKKRKRSEAAAALGRLSGEARRRKIEARRAATA